ncbi:MAG: hypothetical protein L6V93_22455 [Clostridiales bacterium]|nr:MAG: hypothetical protein L6V93_22455 [Clostridiales bacterium]
MNFCDPWKKKTVRQKRRLTHKNFS